MRLRDEERNHGPRDEVPIRGEGHREDGLEQEVRTPALSLVEADAGAHPEIVLLKLNRPNIAHWVGELLIELSRPLVLPSLGPTLRSRWMDRLHKRAVRRARTQAAPSPRRTFSSCRRSLFRRRSAAVPYDSLALGRRLRCPSGFSIIPSAFSVRAAFLKRARWPDLRRCNVSTPAPVHAGSFTAASTPGRSGVRLFSSAIAASMTFQLFAARRRWPDRSTGSHLDPENVNGIGAPVQLNAPSALGSSGLCPHGPLASGVCGAISHGAGLSDGGAFSGCESERANSCTEGYKS